MARRSSGDRREKFPTPDTDTLPAAQRSLLPLPRPGVRMGLTLYGGTAVALHAGHRQFVDRDFFTDRPLNPARLFEAMPFQSFAAVYI